MNDGTNIKAKVKKGCNICHKANKCNSRKKPPNCRIAPKYIATPLPFGGFAFKRTYVLNEHASGHICRNFEAHQAQQGWSHIGQNAFFNLSVFVFGNPNARHRVQ